MRDSILNFTYKKSKQKYVVIGIFVFVSVLIMNMMLQTMSFSLQTIYDGILHSKKLSLIVMQTADLNHKPYHVDVSKIEQLEHVTFVTVSKPLKLSGSKKKDESDDLKSFATYAMNPNFAYYVGMNKMEDDKVYCSMHEYKHLKEDTIANISSNLSVIPSDFTPVMILANKCFMTEHTYKKIVDELPKEYVNAVVPEYIIGVDTVQNVFDVVRQLNGLYADDHPLLLYQAKGLEGLITNASNLLIVLSIAFVIFLIFNTSILAYLASSLVSDVKRDLMVLYLNGLSRRAISIQLFKHCRSYLMRPIIVSSTLSLLIFLFVLQFVLKQPIHLFWIGMLLGIDIVVILINIGSLKVSIQRLVKEKTSNKNISQLIRN